MPKKYVLQKVKGFLSVGNNIIYSNRLFKAKK